MATHTVGPKLEVRLDPDRREKLARLADARDSTVADLVRSLIDQAFERAEAERREVAVDRLTTLEIEDMPDPDELAKQMNARFDGPLP
jgi:hypothetical protein